MTIEEILKAGFYRDGFNGDDTEHCFLSYRYIDNKIVRVTITANPWLIMSKQQKGEKFIFVKVPVKDAEYIANAEIINHNTGQHLFSVYTIRQALKRIHKFNKRFNLYNLQKFIEIYNSNNGISAKLWNYGARVYAPKKIVDLIVKFYER